MSFFPATTARKNTKTAWGDLRDRDSTQRSRYVICPGGGYGFWVVDNKSWLELRHSNFLCGCVCSLYAEALITGVRWLVLWLGFGMGPWKRVWLFFAILHFNDVGWVKRVQFVWLNGSRLLIEGSKQKIQRRRLVKFPVTWSLSVSNRDVSVQALLQVVRYFNGLKIRGPRYWIEYTPSRIENTFVISPTV